MNNNDIEQLIILTGENFYEHLEEKYGKSVVKILRYHDVDSYIILNQVTKQELIELFEKPDDENSTDELVNLKKEICVISQESVSVRIGTKKKVILLLKSTQDMMKKKRSQMTSETRLNQLDRHRPMPLLATDDSNTDTGNNFERYNEWIKSSLDSLLAKLNKTIHGAVYTDVSIDDFKISVEYTNDFSTPICSIQCICGNRVKLYFKNHQFQLSNFIKHVKMINNKRTLVLTHENEELNDLPMSNKMAFDNEVLRNENDRSINHNNGNRNQFQDTEIHNDDTSTRTTSKIT